MKRPFVLIAAIVAVVGFGAVGAVAKQTTEVKTSVTLKFNPGSADPSDDSFSGRVKATKGGCQKGRTVILRSDFAKASSDKTNARGKYEIFSSAPTPPPGTTPR